METKQPKWRMVANLGDVNPFDYGGFFVYVDTTGVYAPEAELLSDPFTDDDSGTYSVHRFILEPCTYVDGVLSDNPFHPGLAAWFADSLPEVASYQGTTELELLNGFCSDVPTKRAWAWRCVGDYHGFENLDSYPLSLSRREVFGRYTSRLRQLNRQQNAA